jgi:hypothetical protein
MSIEVGAVTGASLLLPSTSAGCLLLLLRDRTRPFWLSALEAADDDLDDAADEFCDDDVDGRGDDAAIAEYDFTDAVVLILAAVAAVELPIGRTETGIKAGIFFCQTKE